MHKFLKILRYILIIIIVIVLIAAFRLFYIINLTKHDISTITSPDKLYSVKFQQVGDPAWPFGPTTVKITVTGAKNTSKEKFKRSFTTSINNDGTNVDSDNCNVTWSENYVDIDLYGDEQNVDMRRVYFNK